MHPTDYIKKYAIYWIVIYILYAGWYYFNGLLLFQINPVVFFNKIDISTNLLFITGIQHGVLEYFWVQILLDCLFLSLPLVFIVCFIRGYYSTITAWIIAAYILVYSLLSWIFTYISPETLAGFVFTALLFTDRNRKNFYFRFHALRYLFLLFFFSAAVWKIAEGGIFHSEEMSSILVMQHKQLLAVADTSFYTSFIKFIIEHQWLSYSLYMAAFILEFTFIIGFFTKRFDRLLLAFLVLFIITDLLFMRINYFGWLSYGGLLYFSRNVTEEWTKG